MASHTFESELVEEFYNSCHSKDSGKFCGVAAKGKKILRVPMSDAARRSNAILRRLSSDRKSKEYKQARKNMNDTWANRETGQGGLRHVKGTSSKKADAARAANAKKGAETKARAKRIVKASNTVKFKNENNSGNEQRTSKAVLDLTKRYGGRSRG